VTDAQAWRKWFGESVDVQVIEGGKFSDQAGNSGEFLRVRDGKDLRFTWTHPGAVAATKVEVAIADKGKGKTGITLQHARLQSRDEADGLRAAWTAALDRLKSLLEK